MMFFYFSSKKTEIISYVNPDKFPEVIIENDSSSGIIAVTSEGCSGPLLSAGNYHFDCENVYYKETIVEGLDIPTFRNIGWSGYAKDRKNVFYEGIKIDQADTKTFISVNAGVFRDKNHGYYKGKIIDLSEVRGLTDFLSSNIGGNSLGESYYEYMGDVYFWSDGGGQAVAEMIMTELDFNSFQTIVGNCVWDHDEYKFDPCSHFAKDNHKVYYEDAEIKEADPNTFELIKSDVENAFGKDGKNVFLNAFKLEDADPETFEVLSENYEKDKNNVYLGEWKLEEADPKTFEVADDEKKLAKDDENYFWGSRMVSKKKFKEILEKDEE